MFFMGIDVGTTGCKAGIYDEKGRLISKAYMEYPIESRGHEMFEQSADTWWSAVRKVIRSCLDHARLTGEEVRGVAISGQAPTIVPVDRDGNPLHRAILWMDRRAEKEVEELTEAIGDLAKLPLIPKIYWFKKRLPSIYEKSHKFLQTTDFITYKLTGKYVTDWYNASCIGYLPDNESLYIKVLTSLNIDPDKLPEVVKTGTPVGVVHEKAARETGLSRRTMVVMGSIDAFIAMLGCGCIRDGFACDITGTSTCIMISSSKRLYNRKHRFSSIKHLIEGLWIISAPISTTGASLKWFKDNFGLLETTLKDILPEADAYDLLIREGGVAEPGAGGLIFLPYLAGERSPIWDPNARGVFFGITLNHKRHHVIRALLEGCCLAAKHNLNILTSLGVSIKKYRVCGGASKSDLWNKIKADVLGMKIEKLLEHDASVLGAAIAAAVGSGYYSSFERACEKMVRVEKEYSPNLELKDLYDKLLDLYVELYERVKDLYPRIPK